MSGIEVQLFYIEDEGSVVEKVLPGLEANQSVNKRALLETCISSIKRTNPNVEITFLTNSDTKFHHGIKGIRTIETDEIKPDTLIYDLNCFRRKYIEANKNTNKKVFFTDIDVLVNCDLASLFDEKFDIQVSIDKNSPHPMNSDGLPENNLFFHFTGGGFFSKCNERSLSFFDDYLALWKHIYETESFQNYGSNGSGVRTNFFRWWGEIHTFCVMVGPDVLGGKKDKDVISACKFKFLDEDVYNFAPSSRELFQAFKLPDLGAVHFHLLKIADDLKKKNIIHFRGTRKIFMEEIYKRMLA